MNFRVKKGKGVYSVKTRLVVLDKRSGYEILVGESRMFFVKWRSIAFVDDEREVRSLLQEYFGFLASIHEV